MTWFRSATTGIIYNAGRDARIVPVLDNRTGDMHIRLFLASDTTERNGYTLLKGDPAPMMDVMDELAHLLDQGWRVIDMGGIAATTTGTEESA